MNLRKSFQSDGGDLVAYTSETHLVVRYAETDMMGIVHHSRYYPWFEQARTDFVKKIGILFVVMVHSKELSASFYWK